MNYLAHILLSGPHPDMQVGGLLGDFVKGPLRGGFPPEVERGIQLHRHIDAYTNTATATRELLALFPPPWRRYGGIVIDITWDHLLARNWQDYHPLPLAQFCAIFYAHLTHCEPWLPQAARVFSQRARRIGWLESYADPATIPRVLARVGRQLRQPVALDQVWEVVAANTAEWELRMVDLMADLQLIATRYHELPRATMK